MCLQMLHTAMADIRESLNELKFYRRHIFKQPGIQFDEYLKATHNTRGPTKPRQTLSNSKRR